MLGTRIASLRVQAGMTQRELADLLGIKSSTVGMYEQNRREPTAEKLVEIAKIFQVSLDYLLTGVPENPQTHAQLEDWYHQMAKALRQAFTQENSPKNQEEIAKIIQDLLGETEKKP